MDDKQKVRELLYQTELARKNRLHPIWIELGLIAGQPRVLGKLVDKDNITQKELSDSCGIDPATLSRALDRLETIGYICRMAHPTCRRSLQIALTESGREKAQQVRNAFQEMENQMLKDFSENEIQNLIKIMERILGNMTTPLSL